MEIARQQALAPFCSEPAQVPASGAEADVRAFMRRHAQTLYHPVGTCAMGAGDEAVVDLELRVRGVDGLRVVDASVFPAITNANIYAPTMMVAEKAADLIAGNTPLPPSDAPFYRYRDGSPLHPPGDHRNEKSTS
jgi:choline dehydrogenase